MPRESASQDAELKSSLVEARGAADNNQRDHDQTVLYRLLQFLLDLPVRQQTILTSLNTYTYHHTRSKLIQDFVSRVGKT